MEALSYASLKSARVLYQKFLSEISESQILYVIQEMLHFVYLKTNPWNKIASDWKKRKEKLQLISIQMQTLVLRPRIPENCWDLGWLVVYQAAIIFPVVWKDGTLTCRSCITLKKTLDHCKGKFQLDTCLEFCLLSLVIPPTSRQLQVYSSCSLPAR